MDSSTPAILAARRRRWPRLPTMSGAGGVAVVGSINVDLTAFVSPPPRPGETVVGDRFSMALGGKGANQAVAAARAGAGTVMIGAVGDDPLADLARTGPAEARGGHPELGLPLILDPAPAPAAPLPEEIWAGVRLTKPNEHEAGTITGVPVRDVESAAAAGRWFLDRGVRTALITLGEHGAVLVEADRVTELSAYRVETVDTTA